MQVILADKAGFCFGVNRAVDTVYGEISQGGGRVCTYGPIIHNEQVISDLARRGVRVVNSLDEASTIGGGTMIIRSHGVSRAEQETLASLGFRIVDATCPFVAKIHSIVADYSSRGYYVVIVGNPDHPEVKGIVGWADPDRCAVVQNASEAEKISFLPGENICVVAQTTFNHKKFKDVVEILNKKEYSRSGTVGQIHITVHDTICSATRERQDAARELSRKVDAMIVVGGASSSNTRKLYDICLDSCMNTYFIQTTEDLALTDFSRFDCVGITAGASTPNNIIEEVQKYVRKF